MQTTVINKDSIEFSDADNIFNYLRDVYVVESEEKMLSIPHVCKYDQCCLNKSIFTNITGSNGSMSDWELVGEGPHIINNIDDVYSLKHTVTCDPIINQPNLVKMNVVID